jgi:Flp pilus assembly pilin Flp
MVRFYCTANRVWKDIGGQDMIEYALMAAAIAVTIAGFLPVTLMPSVSTIFSKIVSCYIASAGTSGS